MKIVIISNAYKGNLSSIEVANYIEQGVKRVLECDIIKLAVADGGDGTLDTLVAMGGMKKSVRVLDALGNEVDSYYGILNNNKGVIEMALASGLAMLDKDRLDSLKASTYGTGMLIRALLDEGVRDIIIGIGGSATTDGGTGMAEALGVRFYDSQDNILRMSGGNLSKINKIDCSNIDERIKECKITVAADVSNSLYGENGAALVYSPQKGADKEQVRILDNGLINLSEKVNEYLNKDIAQMKGAGAAGGLGYGLAVFCDAQIKSGIDTILDAIDYEKHLEGADLVFTGEGKIDNQSAYGKVPAGVAQRAKAKGIPVIAIAGSIGEINELYDIGINAVISTAEGDCTLEYAIMNAPRLIANAAERVIRIMEVAK